LRLSHHGPIRVTSDNPVTEIPGGVRVQLLIQPRGSKNEVVGIHEGRVKVKLTAPPVEGAANKALVAYISAVIGVPKRQICLTKGEVSRRKTVEISGVTIEEVETALNLC